MITTIIFDLSEVYLHGFLGVENILEPILKIPSTEIRKKLQHQEELQKLFEGKITEEEYWKITLTKTKWDISINSLKKAVRDNFTEIHGTREIIEKLNKMKFKLGLLSVHSKEWIDYCENKFNYHKLFHSTMYSFEVAICKPNKEAYRLILKKLKSKPEECLFIDDSTKNIKAAKELGIQVILFKNSIELKEDLKNMGIKL